MYYEWIVYSKHKLQRITEMMLDTNVSGLLAAECLEGVIWEQRRSMANFLLTVLVMWKVVEQHGGRTTA